MNHVEIQALQAEYGDCIFVSIEENGNNFNILVDGGTKNTYLDLRMGYPIPGVLRQKLDELQAKGKHIDLLVITHIDNDHIAGILEWFRTNMPSKDFVRKVWFNDNVEIPTYESKDNSKGQAIDLKALFDKYGISYQSQIVCGQEYPFVGGRIYVLAPSVDYHNKVARELQTEIDKRSLNDNSSKAHYNIDIDEVMKQKWKVSLSPSNKASIALLIATDSGKKYLLLGDADIDVVIGALYALGYNKKHKLVCNTVKLAHHGSKNNFKDDFLYVVTADNYIVSTDGTFYGHPDKEVIAHLLTKTKSSILFNYKGVMDRLFTENDKKAYPEILYRCKFIS